MTDEEIYKLWEAQYRSWIGAGQFETIFKHAASIEREACAQICDDVAYAGVSTGFITVAMECAAEIRTRASNQPKE